ncbi:MAG: hypothetical protein V3T17_13210, partial [Pseudomonadales bacterium]
HYSLSLASSEVVRATSTIAGSLKRVEVLCSTFEKLEQQACARAKRLTDKLASLTESAGGSFTEQDSSLLEELQLKQTNINHQLEELMANIDREAQNDPYLEIIEALDNGETDLDSLFCIDVPAANDGPIKVEEFYQLQLFAA